MKNKKLKKVLQLIISILLCQSIGLVGALSVTPESMEWYASLNKPSFTPPSWVFGNVWLVLYTLMGIALFLVWQKGTHKKTVRFATAFFLVHLLFNGIWSTTFFELEAVFLALVNLIIILVMAILSIALFSKIDKRAANLLIPYVIWLIIALVLNWSILSLN